MNRISLLLPFLATVCLAGPPLGCIQFVTAPGSLFERVAPLAKVMIESDDSDAKGQFARDRIASLRAKALKEPTNGIALLEAGYLIQAMNQMSRQKDPDGMRFLMKAMELDPSNADLHLILALALRGEDEAKSSWHLKEARRLMKPGSLTEKNLAQIKTHLAIQ